MNVIVLSENTKLKKSNLKTEHVLSFLVEKDDNKVLFDTGGPEGTAV
jgi:metal-dependent hydrolase (beta-lactamase superfamily II)